ncbi:MAG: Rid family detoxifying hydrolase [Propionibacteriaceae bacterium]|nr:Rid family detoxifying hydrolase [Propionibacteriaceae bacterium]
MKKQAVCTTAAPTPIGAYSQGIVANGFIFTAGFVPKNPDTGAIPDGIKEQTRQVLRNIAAVLESQGATLDDVVKVTAHLENPAADFAEFNLVYAEFFQEPYPARTTVGSKLANFLVEIDVIALLPE